MPPALPSGHRIVTLDAAEYDAAVPDLAALLVDAVRGGASVNFLAGLEAPAAAAWWRDRAGAVDDGTITVLVAREPGTDSIVGSTLLVRARQPNGPHRAEIAKVLVRTRARRLGLARALMAAAEEVALADGRWLLHLDTQTGSDAEGMYRALGWQELGVMPWHSLSVDGVPTAATYFWKDLRPRE
ncbi:MAG: GNAT family N-acetyltransferase [Chloroflexota bacterium]